MAATTVLLGSGHELTAGGKTIIGRLEYYPGSRSMALFQDGGTGPKLLTVPIADSAAELHTLGSDEILLQNWTELRGMPQSLADKGLVELTGKEFAIGPFRLQALVARVL